MNGLWFAICVLATYRLTRLVTADKITEPIRTAVLDRSQWFGYLVTCDWCLSMWIAPPVAFIGINFIDSTPVWVVFGALAFSALSGLIATIEARLDQ